MNKKVLAAFLIITLLLTLTACAQNDPTENAKNNDQKENEILTEPQATVPYDLEVVKNNQEQVDKGSSPWQLDPLQVTLTFVSLQISPQGITGEFPISIEDLKVLQEEDSTAVVEVKSDKTGITKVYLEKLVKQDESGIWTVVGYDYDENRHPSILGIHLSDHKDMVEEVLGKDYIETTHDEAGHFPEPFVTRQYEEGFNIAIGQISNKVLQLIATSPSAKTNLGVKVGDAAGEALEVYRAKYIEPESTFGGELPGVFKVESGQAMILDFNIEDGIVNPEGIKSDAEVERIILTYPVYIDDSF